MVARLGVVPGGDDRDAAGGTATGYRRAPSRVSDSVTGLLVSLYAVMVATLAVPLTLATSRFARKPLLLATLLGYALSNALVAAAPVFGVVAAGRTVGGVTHALFFSLIIGYVPRLVARADVGRALALVGGGASAGFVVGVPLSTSLGTAVGWRASFAVLAVHGGAHVRARRAGCCRVWHTNRPRAGAGRRGRASLAAVSMSNMLTFLGQFTVYTFISVLLLASGVAPVFVGPILLVCGACGLLGLWYVGRDLDRNPRRTAVARSWRRSSARCRTRLRRADSRGCGSRRRGVECRVRGCSVDLPGVRGAHPRGVARNGRGVDERDRQRRHSRWGGHRRRPAPDHGALVAAVGRCVVWRPSA